MKGDNGLEAAGKGFKIMGHHWEGETLAAAGNWKRLKEARTNLRGPGSATVGACPMVTPPVRTSISSKGLKSRVTEAPFSWTRLSHLGGNPDKKTNKNLGW